MKPIQDTHLPRWAWLGLPLALYFGHYVARALLAEDIYDAWLRHESGLTEVFTVVLAAVAFLGGLYVVRWALRTGDRALLAFFAAFTLGCLYFGGEEASWGQHLFDWSTPEGWAGLNNQSETNLHNSNALAGSLLDQLPRNLLAVAMLVGGGIMPLVRRARGRAHTPGSRAYWIMPRADCIAIGFIAPLASIPEKIFERVYDDVPWPFDIEAGEVKEFMFALFFVLYIASVIVRIRNGRGQDSAS